ncbi:hypothetical protein R6Q59_016409 [Mikania micrantha]
MKGSNLLIVIVCFVTPVSDDYIVHNYLVQFVEKLDEVDGYAWGAALLSTFYCAIENKKKFVDANCWPLLAFFCIRIPKHCEALDFHINLENHQGPLLNECMTAMQKFSANKRNNYEGIVSSVLADLEYEEIKWHPYNDEMVDNGIVGSGPFKHTKHTLNFRYRRSNLLLQEKTTPPSFIANTCINIKPNHYPNNS